MPSATDTLVPDLAITSAVLGDKISWCNMYTPGSSCSSRIKKFSLTSGVKSISILERISLISSSLIPVSSLSRNKAAAYEDNLDLPNGNFSRILLKLNASLKNTVYASFSSDVFALRMLLPLPSIRPNSYASVSFQGVVNTLINRYV